VQKCESIDERPELLESKPTPHHLFSLPSPPHPLPPLAFHLPGIEKLPHFDQRHEACTHLTEQYRSCRARELKARKLGVMGRAGAAAEDGGGGGEGAGDAAAAAGSMPALPSLQQPLSPAEVATEAPGAAASGSCVIL
jgi:hypothetical protein